ncbi:hypothetical protein C4D60_Mb05t29200 [Musa balbisiana]|uniref:Uncharacterized protein n=1 Tax=Musa balbisiana TaxID=52838 RepID=A0A4V4H8I9_MUSBA|nr:hypothetical protein C4D60_Mb05t29200 [Musa balbisiana]
MGRHRSRSVSPRRFSGALRAVRATTTPANASAAAAVAAADGSTGIAAPPALRPASCRNVALDARSLASFTHLLVIGSVSPRRFSRSPPRRKRYDDPRDRFRGGGGGGGGREYRDRRSSGPSGLLIRNVALDARSLASFTHLLVIGSFRRIVCVGS